MPEHDVQLWNTPITMPDTFTSHEKSTYQDDNIGEMKDIIINEIPTQDAANLEIKRTY
ncbi:1798_t:CDS:1, partial [Rhizophagus irregularis]